MHTPTVVSEVLSRKIAEIWDTREEAMTLYTEARWIPWLVGKTWEETAGYKMTMRDWRDLLLVAPNSLDANIWSQIYLNSPLSILPTYDVAKMTEDLEVLKLSFQGKEETPFAPKAKMKTGDTGDWNNALALQAALKILQTPTTYTTWKVYSRHQTPALTDSYGLGRINCSMDRYIRNATGSPISVFPEPISTGVITPEGAVVPGYAVPFKSSSGNWDVLWRVLGIRETLRDKFLEYQGVGQFIPRFTSVTVIPG